MDRNTANLWSHRRDKIRNLKRPKNFAITSIETVTKVLSKER